MKLCGSVERFCKIVLESLDFLVLIMNKLLEVSFEALINPFRSKNLERLICNRRRSSANDDNLSD
jgi:hypothetical protein